MEQSLIDKYLAGENTPQEAQQLKQLLEAKPSSARTAKEQALLLMLTGVRQKTDEDIFSTDYSDEYEDVVRKNMTRKLGKIASAVIAIAACIAAVWFVGTHQWKNAEMPETASKHQVAPSQPESSPVVADMAENDSDSTTVSPDPEQPMKERVQPDANHFAWAKGLIESYKEDDLGEITDLAENPSKTHKEDDTDWAQK